MRTSLRWLLVMLVGTLGIAFAPHALAAGCNSFTITSNSPVTEGDKVTVTVHRAGTEEDSSVLVITKNDTAKAPGDYKATIERVYFTDELVKSFQIATTQDAFHEDTEQFKLALSSGEGCRTESNYTYGPPATVVINDDDPSGATVTPTPHGTTTPKPSATPAASASPSPSPSESPTPTPEATESPAPTAMPTATPASDDKNPSAPLVGLAVGFLVLAAFGAVVVTRWSRNDFYYD